ncbi:MAG: hypothetical protein U0354_05590 [Candidatus Sericytochromatia bacterium]
MKKNYLIIFLFLLNSCVTPQNVNPKVNIEPLYISNEKDVFADYLSNKEDSISEERISNYFLKKSYESIKTYDYNRSFEYLLKGLKLNFRKYPDYYFRDFLRSYSQVYSINENSEENYTNFIEFIKKNINNNELLKYAYNLQKDFYIKEYDLNKAKKSFDNMINLIEINTSKKDSLYNYLSETIKFYSWFYENNEEAMIKLYNELLEKYKVSDESILEWFYKDLSKLYYLKGDYSNAVDYLNKINEIDKDNIRNTEVIKLLIDIYIILDDEKNILKYYQQLITKNNYEKCDYKNIANYYYSKKQYKEALKYYKPENCK